MRAFANSRASARLLARSVVLITVEFTIQRRFTSFNLLYNIHNDTNVMRRGLRDALLIRQAGFRDFSFPRKAFRLRFDENIPININI